MSMKSKDRPLKLETHKRRWRGCKQCDLHKTRTRVVLSRGTVPCMILFIGEAPGTTEDREGKPFVGDAGEVFDDALVQAQKKCNYNGTLNWAVTNLIGCLPINEDPAVHSSFRVPSDEEVEHCASRLEEYINRVARPYGIILLGRTAEYYLGHLHAEGRPVTSIYHPSYIRRMGARSNPSLWFAYVTDMAMAIDRIMLPHCF